MVKYLSRSYDILAIAYVLLETAVWGSMEVAGFAVKRRLVL